MKKILSLGVVVFAAGSLLAAEASPKDDVINAAAALGRQTNYSWQTTVEFGLLHSSTTQSGKTELDGYTTFSRTIAGDGAAGKPIEAVIKGTNAAVKSPDDGWRSAAEVLRDNGGGFSPAKALARTAQNLKPPAIMAANLAAQARILKAGTNGISGELNGDGVKSLLGDSLAAGTNRYVSVTFWITDGRLAKYQWHATGTVKFNGSDREINRTATTEITDVNTTKIDVPEEAKKKLE